MSAISGQIQPQGRAEIFFKLHYIPYKTSEPS